MFNNFISVYLLFVTTMSKDDKDIEYKCYLFRYTIALE